MKDAFLSLLRSRKVLVYLFVSLLGAVFVLAGKLSTERFASFVAGLSGVLIAAIAYEDGQEKRGASSGAPGDAAAPRPLVPPLPPRARPPADSSTRLMRFALGASLLLVFVFLLGGCAAANAAQDAAGDAYRAEQDACFDTAERDSVTCTSVQPARDACMANVRKSLHDCRAAVKARWRRA